MSQPPQLVIHEDANGKYTFHVGQLSSVDIKNIGNVERHDINTAFGSRSHVVRFVNGGVLQCKRPANPSTQWQKILSMSRGLLKQEQDFA
jgi:hypothetical protein